VADHRPEPCILEISHGRRAAQHGSACRWLAGKRARRPFDSARPWRFIAVGEVEVTEQVLEATAGAPEGSDVDRVMHRNIRMLLEARQRLEKRRSFQERVADRITGFTGSMRFVYIHATVFGAWILMNLGVVPRIKPFDPFPFVMLAMIASVEAIFLSTFVLISQNRSQALADRRADLDVQINLLTEHEITRLLQLVDDIARHMGVHRGTDAALEELKKDVNPEAVLEELDRAERRAHGGNSDG
jgi:uncharacterized membrane protein